MVVQYGSWYLWNPLEIDVIRAHGSWYRVVGRGNSGMGADLLDFQSMGRGYLELPRGIKGTAW